MTRIRPVLTLAAIVCLCPAVASAQDPTTGEILRDATSYILEFVDQFTNVVAEERYEQEASTVGAGIGRATSSRMRRVLRSDLLLVKRNPDDPWLIFRDVVEVDGRAVSDRSERLADLFIRNPDGDFDLAQRIALEGTRYHLDGASGGIDNPLAALAYLQPYYQWRFQFELDGRDRGAGPDVWRLRFHEVAQPALAQDIEGRDLPSSGRFSVERGTGRVLRSVLELGDNHVESSFAYDDEIGVAVPVEMNDRYSRGAMDFRGRARYGRFRRFNVSTSEAIPDP